MITRRSLVTMAAWMALAAVVGAAPGNPPAKKAVGDHDRVAARIQGFIAAYNAGDLQKLMSYYAEDLVKSRQGGVTETKKDTADRMLKVFDRWTGELSVSTEELVTSGDMAYARGTLKAVLTPRQGLGKDQVIERRFLEIWRKQKGEWFIARTMDNEIVKLSSPAKP